MSNWNKYKSTLNYLKLKINYYEEELKKYYKTIIFNNKIDNIDEDIMNLNPALFTYFNNVPDVFHPLTKQIYYDYVCYISFIDPSFINQKNEDIIKYKNFLNLKYFKQKYLIKQDISPYNYFKRNLSINIKYFDIKKYLKKKYILIIYTDERKKYIINKESDLNFTGNIVYVNILRKIKSKELHNVFLTDEIKKGTKIYSFHYKNYKDNNNLTWFSLDKNNMLNDPYHIFYKDNDINYMYIFEIQKNLNVINLSKNIFLKDQSDLDNLLNNTKQNNKIYNGFVNYIKFRENNLFNFNRGKRLLNEIFYKNSSFINLKLYYFDYLNYHNINYFLYTLGFYEKLNKYYDYELGFKNYDPKLYKRISVEEIKIKR
jgi:hypothetical protein